MNEFCTGKNYHLLHLDLLRLKMQNVKYKSQTRACRNKYGF